MSEKKTDKFLVLSDFASFKKDEQIELPIPLSSAAKAHVIPLKGATPSTDDEALKALRELYVKATEKEPGRSGISKLAEAIAAKL